ncbi:MAG TPA: NADH-quinone oxidoreductase subunit L, partial [Hyphomicrobiaceae bacterium]|nr:NADH-quinone oxidoreductase subunit L [Hyphomicrobiaceae bacterium]
MIYEAIVLLPALGALIAGFLGRIIGARASELITTSFLALGAALSWVVFWQIGFGAPVQHVRLLRWVTSGELDVSWTLRIDTLTAVMLVVVNTVSFLVHFYSIGYMADDDSRP